MTTRNQRYEEKKKAMGLVKRTYWVPVHCEVEVSQIIECCVEDREYIPFMVRNLKTGKMKKGI